MNEFKKISKIMYQHWMKFAYFIGEINFKIIFSALFFVLIGIYAIIKKIFNLAVEEQSGRWVRKKYTEPEIETLRRQF